MHSPSRHCEEPLGVRKNARLSTAYSNEAIQRSDGSPTFHWIASPGL